MRETGIELLVYKKTFYYTVLEAFEPTAKTSRRSSVVKNGTVLGIYIARKRRAPMEELQDVLAEQGNGL